MGWADTFLVQPTNDPEGFWERVAEDPSTVVVAEDVLGNRTKVFSSIATAKVWIDAEDVAGVVVYAARIDEPGWPDAAH